MTTLDSCKAAVSRLGRTYRQYASSERPHIALGKCDRARDVVIAHLEDRNIYAGLRLLISKHQPSLLRDARREILRIAARAPELAAAEVDAAHGFGLCKQQLQDEIMELHHQMDDLDHYLHLLGQIETVDELQGWVIGRHDRFIRAIDRTRTLPLSEKKYFKRALKELAERTGEGLLLLVSNIPEPDSKSVASYVLGMRYLSKRLQDLQSTRLRPYSSAPIDEILFE